MKPTASMMVILGDGLRHFPEHGQSHHLAVVESRFTSTGVLQTDRLAGRALFGRADEA